MIEFKNVSKHFGPTQVLHDISLKINQGEVVVIIGPSGSGKSTMLRCINKLEEITSGDLIVDGLKVNDPKVDERLIRQEAGMVFQQFYLFPHLTALENVMFGPLRVRGASKQAAEKQAKDLLAKVGLAERAHHYPSELSGGQQQRVALARAVVIEPSVLLFDEPLSNLDAKLRESMRDELRALQQRLGITSLYVTHDQSEAMAISDKVVIMKDGVICQQGTPQEIYEQPASRFVANFIGKANFIDGIFKGRDGEAALVEIGGKTFSIPAPGKMEGVEVGGACCLTVRPESFLLTKDAGALPGTVSRATYYGAKIEYEVMLNEQPIIVEVYNPQLTERFSVGDTVTMSLIEGCVRVLK